MANSKKYIHDLATTSDQLASQDKVIIEKADGSGTKIMSYTDLIASVTSTILKNNGTTTSSGYALDARYGKTLTDILTPINEGKLPIVATSATSDLDTVYANQSNDTIMVIKGQNELNQPATAGYIHFVLSVRRNQNYGQQYTFQDYHTIYGRTLSNGTWGAWNLVGTSQIVTTTFQCTGFKNSAGTAAGDFTIEKNGHTGVIRFTGSVDSLAAGTEVSFENKIPEGYRPKYAVTFWTMSTTQYNGTGTRTIQVTLGTDGSVTFYNYGTAISSQYVYRFRETYLIP